MSLYRLPVFLGPLETQPPPPQRAPSRWGRFFWGDCLPTSATLQWPHAPRAISKLGKNDRWRKGITGAMASSMPTEHFKG